MNRPKKEELKDIREIGGIYTIDFTRYIDALEKYVDQLEKVFDKACEVLEKWDINNFDNTTVTKEQWKEELMKDEED